MWMSEECGRKILQFSTKNSLVYEDVYEALFVLNEISEPRFRGIRGRYKLLDGNSDAVVLLNKLYFATVEFGTSKF